MKLYYYSSEFVTVKEAKGIIAQFFLYGIIIGTVVFFGFMMLDQSVDHAFGSHTANALVMENTMLKKQLVQLSPLVNMMEIQQRELFDRDGVLQILLHNRRISGDSISRFSPAINGFMVQSVTHSKAADNP